MNLFCTTVLFLPLLQAGALVCLFFLCFDHYHSAKDHHGCLVKEQRQVFPVFRVDGSGTVLLQSIPSSNIEDCSEACADENECDTFYVDNRKKCRLYKGGSRYIYEHASSTAGFCPKGIVSLSAQTNSYKLLTLIYLERRSKIQQQWH